MAQPPIVMAADYADTIMTCRLAKNWLVLLLLLALLTQLAIFFTARYSSVLPPAADAQAATEPAMTVEALSPTPARQMMRYLTGLTAYAGIVLSIVLVLVLLVIMNVMLTARLVGLAKVASAFVWCLILMGLLFPWQAFLNRTSATAGDLRIPGVLFTWSELVTWGKFGVNDTANAVLKWSRFVAFPILSICVVLFIHMRSRRGMRLALGEQAPA